MVARSHYDNFELLTGKTDLPKNFEVISLEKIYNKSERFCCFLHPLFPIFSRRVEGIDLLEGSFLDSLKKLEQCATGFVLNV